MKKFITSKNLLPYLLPYEVQAAVSETLEILDSYYGTDRTEAQLGGYVIVVENERDIHALNDVFKSSIQEIAPEIVDVISENYVKALYIINPDFSITIIFPKALTPKIVTTYL